MIIPNTTENTDIAHEIKIVFLNPLPNINAVIFGITINEEISKTPTSLMDAIMVILARTMNKVLIHVTFRPLTLAWFSSNTIRTNFLYRI